MLRDLVTTRWKGATAALQSRSLLVSLGLHVGLAGALYGFGWGTWHPSDSRRLAISFEQPEPTPYVEELPEPVEEEKEPEEKVEIELDKPIIEEPIDEPLPEPEFLIEDTPPDRPVHDEVWLSKILIRKQPTPPKATQEKKTAEPVQKPLLHTIEPKPLVGKNPPPDYPKFAIRNRLEGTTLLEVKVDDEGIVGDIRILHSSGYKILDEAAVRAVKHWRFDSGPGTAEIPIVFTLQARK